MNDGQFNDRRLTALEERAFSEATEQFDDQLTQFGLGQDARGPSREDSERG